MLASNHYIFLNRRRAMIIRAVPATNPIIADRRMATSVPRTTDGEYCDHVWQSATHTPDSSDRKKFSWQGWLLVFKDDASEPESTTGI